MIADLLSGSEKRTHLEELCVLHFDLSIFLEDKCHHSQPTNLSCGFRYVFVEIVVVRHDVHLPQYDQLNEKTNIAR